MKLIIKCECGNCMEVEPKTRGNVAYFNQELIDNDFYIGGQEHDIDFLNDTAMDENDVNAKLKELRIDCSKCGQYMILDCD